MYFTVAQDGKILSVNQFGAQQLGHSVEELVGQPVIDLFVEDDQPQVQATIYGLFESTLWPFFLGNFVSTEGQEYSLGERNRTICV